MKDLNRFDPVNAEEKASGKRISWEERYAIICEEFPETVQIDWHDALRDTDTFGRLLRGILKDDQALSQRSGPGPRSDLDVDRARHRLRQWLGDDFSYEPFLPTLKMLVGGRSIRRIAHKTGIHYSMVFKMLNGEREPDIYLMEKIAAAFDKHPSFFLEWRVAFVVGALAKFMERSPESSVAAYQRIRKEMRRDGH